MSIAPILEVDMEHPNPRHITRAVQVLNDGGLIAYPTDTYYAVGCNLFSKKAIDRLYELKGRDRKKPLAFLCADLSDVAEYAHVNNFAYRMLRQLTPGAFTFVMRATRKVPDMMATKQREVGIRIPDAAFARAMAKELGHPLVTASANNREGEPLIDAHEIKEELGNRLDLILDGGIIANEPSTVVSLLEDHAEILRQGKGILE